MLGGAQTEALTVKIVHTSDWHIGRRWKGIQRLDELEAVLDHLAGFHRKRIHRPRPPLRGRLRKPKPSRRGGAAGEPVPRPGGPIRSEDGGDRRQPRRSAPVGRPFAPHRIRQRPDPRPAPLRLAGRDPDHRDSLGREGAGGRAAVRIPRSLGVRAGLGRGEASARSKYARMFERAVQDLCGDFQPDAVNVLMAHTHIEGASFGESERRVHIGEDWAASPEALPRNASYIALGHIHKPQKIEGPVPAYYAGSLLQMDFGEAGEEKTFVVVTASPGKRAVIDHVPYEGGLPLFDLRASLAELEAAADPYREGQYRKGWLRVTVPLVGEGSRSQSQGPRAASQRAGRARRASRG